MKHVKLGDLDVARIGLGAWACRPRTPAPAPTTPSRSAPSTGRSTWASRSSTPPRSTGPSPTRSSSAGRIQGRRDDVVLATKFGIISHPAAAPATSTAAPRTSAPRSTARCNGSAPTTSTSTTSTASTRTPRSRTPSARSPSSSPRARSATSGCRRPAPDTIRRAHAVHPITALQSEYSLLTRDPEPAGAAGAARARHRLRRRTRRSAGGSSPGTIRSTDEFDATDCRMTNPRFTGENFQRNLRLVDEVAGDRRRGRRHAGAGRDRVAAGPGRRHRPHPRDQARRPGRGERRGRRGRAHPRADRQAQRPHPGRRRPPQRAADADDRALTAALSSRIPSLVRAAPRCSRISTRATLPYCKRDTVGATEGFGVRYGSAQTWGSSAILRASTTYCGDRRGSWRASGTDQFVERRGDAVQSHGAGDEVSRPACRRRACASVSRNSNGV